jgi:hypothetical protein
MTSPEQAAIMDNANTVTLPAAGALALRYGAEAAPAPGPWNEHIALLLSHRSIRGYRPDPPPPGTLETLVAAAQTKPLRGPRGPRPSPC